MPSLADYDVEIERITEWLNNTFGNNIKDRNSFNFAFRREIIEDNDPKGFKKTLENAVFKEYLKQHPDIDAKETFKDAGGDDLGKDKQTRAKEVTTSREEYIKRGASKIDFEGLDTPDIKVGTVKNKVVKVKPKQITLKGKKIVRFVDSRGRFAKVKK